MREATAGSPSPPVRYPDNADFVVAVTGYFHEIVVPGFPWIDAQLVVGFAGQKIPGALDILGGE